MQTERNIIKTPNSRKYARVHTKQQLRQRQKRRLKRHRLADTTAAVEHTASNHLTCCFYYYLIFCMELTVEQVLRRNYF